MMARCGTPTCAADCSGIDYSSCVACCGNGSLDSGEECDGSSGLPPDCNSNPSGDRCGMPTCNTTTCTIEYGACTSCCGNGMIDPPHLGPEECDGSVIDPSYDCELMGMCGDPTCNPDCTVDTSVCTTCP